MKYDENCVTNKKMEETSFVSQIIHALVCSVLYLMKLCLKKSTSEIELQQKHAICSCRCTCSIVYYERKMYEYFILFIEE